MRGGRGAAQLWRQCGRAVVRRCGRSVRLEQPTRADRRLASLPLVTFEPRAWRRRRAPVRCDAHPRERGGTARRALVHEPGSGLKCNPLPSRTAPDLPPQSLGSAAWKLAVWPEQPASGRSEAFPLAHQAWWRARRRCRGCAKSFGAAYAFCPNTPASQAAAAPLICIAPPGPRVQRGARSSAWTRPTSGGACWRGASCQTSRGATRRGGY